MSDLARRLRAVRERIGLTQEQLAERSSTLHRVEVVALEAGRNKASTSRVREALARGLGVDPQRLVAYLIEDKLTLDELLAPAKQRFIDRPSRYSNRERAIQALILLGQEEGQVREAADAFAVALQADEDPDPEWWAEGIRRELNLQRKPWKRVASSERILAEDDESEPSRSAGRKPGKRTSKKRRRKTSSS
ncbi:MAG TPA: helix-turn-helix transcriptional regulator [Polyangiaceae bacterium]